MLQIIDKQKITKEFAKTNFIFCEKGLNKFDNEFYVEKKELSFCPSCGETSDINNYNDMFICFKCKTKVIWNSHEYDLCIHNGYLCRISKSTQKIGYFHRFLFANEIRRMAEKNTMNVNQIHIHHINENIKDNRIVNLASLTDKEHEEHHRQVGLIRKKDLARDTFLHNREEKQGFIEAEDYMDFDEWWEKKDEHY